MDATHPLEICFNAHNILSPDRRLSCRGFRSISCGLPPPERCPHPARLPFRTTSTPTIACVRSVGDRTAVPSHALGLVPSLGNGKVFAMFRPDDPLSPAKRGRTLCSSSFQAGQTDGALAVRLAPSCPFRRGVRHLVARDPPRRNRVSLLNRLFC